MSCCPCGGAATPKSSSKRKKQVSLDWVQCGACGRAGGWRMYRTDECSNNGRRLVAKGQIARRAFNDDKVVDQVLRRDLTGATDET